MGAGVGKLQRMAACSADVLGLDWSTDMAEARSVLGHDRVLQGNVDPAVLFASEVSPAPVQSSCPLVVSATSAATAAYAKCPDRQVLRRRLSV